MTFLALHVGATALAGKASEVLTRSKAAVILATAKANMLFVVRRNKNWRSREQKFVKAQLFCLDLESTGSSDVQWMIRISDESD